MSKSRDFGLPTIGGGAAALLKPRRASREEERREEVMPRDEMPRPLESQIGAPDHLAPAIIPPPSPIATTVTHAISPSTGGRPKKPPSKRMHVSIEERLAAYLNRAWRTHERPDGSLADGPSDLIEDLLSAHRLRNASK